MRGCPPRKQDFASPTPATGAGHPVPAGRPDASPATCGLPHESSGYKSEFDPTAPDIASPAEISRRARATRRWRVPGLRRSLIPSRSKRGPSHPAVVASQIPADRYSLPARTVRLQRVCPPGPTAPTGSAATSWSGHAQCSDRSDLWPAAGRDRSRPMLSFPDSFAALARPPSASVLLGIRQQHLLPCLRRHVHAPANFKTVCLIEEGLSRR